MAADNILLVLINIFSTVLEFKIFINNTFSKQNVFKVSMSFNQE